MRKLFISTDGRPRAGWRVFMQFILFMVVLMTAQGIQDASLRAGDAVGYTAGSLVYIAGILLVMQLFSRFIDRRPLQGYGLLVNREWWLDLVAGLFIGAFTLCGVALAEKSLGWVEFTNVSRAAFSVPLLVTGLLSFLNLAAVGLGEELTFRGYQMTTFAEGFGRNSSSRKALILSLTVSSIFFGLVHLMNPNASFLPAVIITLAGLLLGLSYVWSGSLALPVGIHVAWGFFEEFVFGFANSGQAPANSLLQNTGSGPALWTGGTFGPEGGLLILILIAVDVLLVWLWTINRRGMRENKYNGSEFTRLQH